MKKVSKAKRSGSSRREKRVAAKDIFTKPLTKTQKAELQALRSRPDSAIDYSDAPEMAGSAHVIVGRFYRPIKQLVSLRMDADVLAWFRSKGGGYQTRINAVLRKEMESTGAARNGSRQ